MVEGAPPAPVGEARRGAPVGGKSRNGVNRPGPSPTSPPSGGSGPGVGLGEVLQCPKGAPPRPAVVWVRLGAAAALLVAPCRGADHNGGADRLRPRRPMGHGLGPGGHGPPPWRAGEPVAFPRAPRSPAEAPASTIWPPGPAPSPCASRRRASEPARPPGGHRSRRAPPADQRSLAAPASSCWDAPTEPTRLLPESLMIGQLSGQPAFPGPLFERSGQQATGPSDHRPHPNRSARTSRPTPHRNATAPPHPRPPTRAITSSVITYRSFQIKGIHRQLNTPRR